MAPYPLGGRPRNTHDRIAQTAQLAGVDILAWQAAGTGRYTFRDLRHRAIAPKNFRYTCEDEVAAIYKTARGYDSVVGWGDSRAVANILGMHGVEPFERVLLRDGINLQPGNRLKRVVDFVRYDESEYPLPKADMPPDMHQTLASKAATLAMILGEIANYSTLLAGRYTLDRSYELVQDPLLPLHIVGVNHSFSDPERKTAEFLQGLKEMRQHVGEASGEGFYAALRTDVMEGGHAYLESPTIAARHIVETINLRDVITE